METRSISRAAHVSAAALTGVLLVATLFSRQASYVSPAHGGFWALAALALPVLLALDAVALVGWLACRRWRLALLPLAGIVLCSGYIASIVRLPVRPQADTSARDLRIMTLNAYGFLRLGDHFTTIPAILRLVAREDVDVMCLQEAPDSPYFPGDTIVARFSVYFPYFVRGDGIAIGSRYPIINHRYITLPGTLSDCMWADIAMGSDTLRIFTTHLQTTGFTELKRQQDTTAGGRIPLLKIAGALARNSRIRAEQVDEIRQAVDSARHPTILTGDLNDLPGTYTYRRLKGSHTDSFRAAGRGLGSTYRRMGGCLRIDQVFLDKSFETLRHSILPDDVSDHSAVVVDLRFDR